MSSDFPRLPVTLLTGFLGSGKTTLLNCMLTAGPIEGLAEALMAGIRRHSREGPIQSDREQK